MSTQTGTLGSVAAPAHGYTPLLELATREVFAIMLGAGLQPALGLEQSSTAEFTAMVGLAGQLCGVITLRCNTATAVAVATRMLGLPASDGDSAVWDALGELCNMIAGDFKGKITGLADRCLLSVPTVIRGGDYRMRSLTDRETIEVSLLFEGAPIWVGMELHS